jgi:hypothetical protein
MVVADECRLEGLKVGSREKSHEDGPFDLEAAVALV